MAEDGKFVSDAAKFFAGVDPIMAARALASGCRRQPRGAKLSIIRVIAEAFAAQEPDFMADLRAYLRGIA